MFGVNCPGCGSAGWSPCPHCVDRLEAAGVVDPPRGVDDIACLFAHAGVGVDLVAALKYRGRRALVPWMADGLAAAAPDVAVDAVVWVPASRRGRRMRGFDQGRSLAKALGRRLDLPALGALRRLGSARQTGGDRRSRARGPVLTIAPTLRSTLMGRRVLLVDDVMTTGSSLAAAARELREHGVMGISALVVAHRPRHCEVAEAL